MTKYFELLLDLLEIENKDSYIEIAKTIESNRDKKVKAYHQYFFIFEWYKKLLEWDMEPEEFLQLGDMWSSLRFDHDKLDSITFLQSNPKLNKDTIYIFDSLSEGLIPTAKNVYYA